MKKKGILLAEETLKLIVAVIAIGFLAYFLFSLYQTNRDSKEIEQAKATLNFIMSEIKAGKTTIDVYNPKNWWIQSWPDNIEAPKACRNLGFDGCICICKESTAESCDETDLCVDEAGFSLEDPIQIENPPMTLEIEHGLKKISKEQQ